VTAVPVCAHVALQPCDSVCPDGNVKPSVQPDSVLVPVFVSRTVPVNPAFQPFAEYRTEQAPVVASGAVVTDSGAEAADTLPATSLARTVNAYAVAGLRPVTVRLGVVVDPTSVVPR
jgi:hypothetical protein